VGVAGTGLGVKVTVGLEVEVKGANV